MISSHRAKIEERRFYRKLLLTIVSLVGIGLFLVFIGLPLLARFIVFFTSLTPNTRTTTTNATDQTVLIPPDLDPVDEATNSSPISLSGYGESNGLVKIYLNGKQRTKVDTQNDGKFIASDIDLKEGENTIYATTVDKNNRESSPSSTFTITFSKNPPKLDISDPEDGAKYSSEQKDVQIKGSTDAGNRITINDRYVVVDPYGKFSFSASLSNGDNEFTVKSTDPAGNTSEKKIKVTYYP